MTYIIAVGSIPYHKYPKRTFSDITLETLIDLQKDLKEETMILSRDTEEIFFGTCAMDRFGQSNIRGQVALQEAIDQGILPTGLPISNIEAGCATGGVTLYKHRSISGTWMLHWQ